MRNLKRVLSMALALVMVLGMMVIGSSAATFTDADEITYQEAVDVMSAIGVIDGIEAADGTFSFNPTETLTREQGAKIVCYLLMGKTNAEKLVGSGEFTDVAADRWSAGAIDYCASLGILDGVGNGKFDPTGPLTAVQFGKMLLCALGYDADIEGYTGKNWATNIAVDMVEVGLDIYGVSLDEHLTREAAAQMALQTLECSMVKYANKGTSITVDGVVIVSGASEADEVRNYAEDETIADDNVLQFAENYYPGLTKTGKDTDIWGNPYKYAWELDTAIYPLYIEWFTPVAVYTEAVTECDIASDLGLKVSTTVSALTVNGNTVNVNKAAFLNGNAAIDPTATRSYVGEQGRLTMVYKTAKNVYEVVMIDQFLAMVTDVTDVEYDKAGHIEEYAHLELAVFAKNETETITLDSVVDWDYSKFDMLLVNAVTEDYTSKKIAAATSEDYAEVIGEAEALVGTQTELTTKASHVVEDVEYMDAFQFVLDDAQLDGNKDYTWYFDSYGNLIGAEEIDAIYNYGVISSIYWKDSSDGEDGKAIAKIVYMDGESETVTVYAAEGIGTDKDRKGVDHVIVYGDIEDTKEANKAICNNALYQIESGKDGLILTLTTELENPVIETGVSTIDRGDAYADKNTMFLVWTGKAYKTYTGIKNIPTYEDAGTVWAADVTGADNEAEYIFVIKPSEGVYTTQSLYFNTDVTDVRTSLKDEIYTVYGGYVNHEKDVAIEIEYDGAYDENAVWKDLDAGKLAVLTLADGYVIASDPVTNVPVTLDYGRTWNVYAGKLDGTTNYVNRYETLLYIGEESYDIETVTLIGAEDWDDAADKYIYIVYTQNVYTNYKTAEYVYVTRTQGDLAEEETPAVENNLREVVINGVKGEYAGGSGTQADPYKYVATDCFNGVEKASLTVTAMTTIDEIDIFNGAFTGKGVVGTGEGWTFNANNKFTFTINGTYYVATIEVLSHEAALTVKTGYEAKVKVVTNTIYVASTFANEYSLTLDTLSEALTVSADANAYYDAATKTVEVIPQCGEEHAVDYTIQFVEADAPPFA